MNRTKSGFRYGFSMAIMMCMLLIALGWGMLKVEPLRDEALYNHTRLLVVDELKVLEQGKMPKSPYAYAVIDLYGKVIYADERFGFQEQVPINETIQFDRSFWKENTGLVKSTFVLEKEGKASGFVIFLIPEQEAFIHSKGELILNLFGPLVIVVIGVGIAVVAQSIYFKRYFLKPVEKICLSAESIIKGNYEIIVRENQGKELKSNEIDELTYVFELMRDELKARQERENQLKKSQKELIACISHDLKTPISSIKAYSEGLTDGIIIDPEKRKRYAEVILHKTDALNSMIDDLLEHSKAELNALTIEKTEVYFKDYFDQVTMEFKLMIQKQGMNCDIQSEVPNQIIELDPRRLTQVLENLVSNSMKYAGEGNWIGIRGHIENRNLVMSVADRGKGIEHFDIPYVFDKFYRGEKSRSSSLPGSGLGLSICKYIVEAHGGRIECESKVGEGTCFRIYLPI